MYIQNIFLQKLLNRASGLVVKSNVAIVGPRVRFPAGACPGGLAQLVERSLRMREVAGSIPASSKHNEDIFFSILFRLFEIICTMQSMSSSDCTSTH